MPPEAILYVTEEEMYRQKHASIGAEDELDPIEGKWSSLDR